MIRLVSWNIGKRTDPLALPGEDGGARGQADVALLQEAGNPPDSLEYSLRYEDGAFRDRSCYDRWPLIVQLSNRVEVEWFRQVPPWSDVGASEFGVSDIATIAAARVTPRSRPQGAFIAVSMYAVVSRII